MSTQVVNLSLRHLGSSNEVSDYLTERSQEARAARAFFEIARDEALRDCKLPISRRRVKLAVVSEDPEGLYMYAYRIPSDCLDVRGLVLPQPVSSYLVGGGSLPAYEISSDDSGGLIYSNIAELQIYYTHRITNMDQLPSDFRMALSYKLAFYMAPSISGGDPFKRGQTCAAAYDVWVGKCMKNAYNEEPGQNAPPSELVNAHYYMAIDNGYPISGRSDA